VRQGELKKRNEYYWKQVRHFALLKDGTVKYYKDYTLHRGTIVLCKDTKIVKTNKVSFEIVTPARTYYLYDAANDAKNIQLWVDDLKTVVSTL